MNKSINISNYEAYAIDFLEGRLEGELLEAFMEFLSLHPDISAELESMREIPVLIPQQSPASIDKKALHIHISPTANIDESNAEEKFIAAAEELLNEEEVEELHAFLGLNPSLVRDHALYVRTRLQADASVVYPKKSSLKRAIPLYTQFTAIAYRVAAVLVIALGGLALFNALKQEQYIPRLHAPDFATLEVHHTREVPAGKAASGKAGEQPADPTALMASNTVNPVPEKALSTDRSTAPESIPAIDPVIEPVMAALEVRNLEAYAPEVALWQGLEQDHVGDENRGKSTEMTLAQFIASRVFGLQTERTQGPQDLIREGLLNTLGQNENLAFTASPRDEDKRSFEFLAGNFEFRRVSYK